MPRKSKSAARPPSKRQLRVGEEVRHVLASMFIRRDTYIEELNGVSITVSEVSVSPDLSNAKVFIMPLGGADVETILPILNQMAPVFGHQVSQQVHLRRMPKLKFLLDGSFDHVDRISYLFNNLPDETSDETSGVNSDLSLGITLESEQGVDTHANKDNETSSDIAEADVSVTTEAVNASDSNLSSVK